MPKPPREIEPIDASFDEVVSAISPKATPVHKVEDEVVQDFELAEYTDPGRIEPIEFRLDPGTETVWATQAQIAELFETERSNVTKHLGNIFQEGELSEKGNVRKWNISNSAKPVKLYSLDAVISVGYRVNSRAATRFRQWATKTIKAYIQQGYVLNEQALRKSPEKLNRLAAEIRALRSEEKQIYAKVRECFKISASDYDPSSDEWKKFYATLQNKFLHAVKKMDRAKIIMDRADHMSKNMGVKTFKGREPTLAEATVGKNYLDNEELYKLHVLSEQFLLHAESSALMGRKMTMGYLRNYLDDLLEFEGYPVFRGNYRILKDDAERHARLEHALYKKRLKIEALGIEYEEEALVAGEYDEILMD
ncbi:MAG: RhuM family protein [Pseudomonadota bacterium]